VADCCARHGALLVLDEAFIDFCGEEHSMARCLSQAGTAIVLRSLTKFYAIPGLRLGYAVASQALCARLATLRGPWSVNSLAQAAGCAAMTDAGFRERSQWLVARERERLFRRISLIPLLQPFPGAANYLLVRLRDGGEAEGLRMALLQRRIVIRNCANFAGLDGSFFRIAVRRPRQNDLLVHHMAAIIGKNKLIK
jgi:threonine-phosphate decarboxylase